MTGTSKRSAATSSGSSPPIRKSLTVRQIVSDTLQSLDLAGYEDRITHQLSGGEKRLVALATVLAMRPEVLLLDEPTSGLDQRAAGRLVTILAELPQAMALPKFSPFFRSFEPRSKPLDHCIHSAVLANDVCGFAGRAVDPQLGDSASGG